MNAEQMNKSRLCAQLWNGVVVKPEGCYGICCEVTDDLTDMHVRTHTFAEAQQHPRVVRMRQEMEAGKEPPECWRCFSKEKLGAHSLRHSLNDTYYGINGDFDPTLIVPQNVEFVLGNLCQLRCVMCSPVRSKKVEEAHKHVVATAMRPSFMGHVVMKPFQMDVSWVEDPKLWDRLAEESKHARRIYINGGEPLLAREHEKVLKRLIETGVAKQTLLVYSTNGLLLSDEHLTLWREFKHVAITFSLDDLEDRNHFVRYPSDWGQVTAALERVNEWRTDPANSNIDISIWCAINMLSFMYLDEFVSYFGMKYPDMKLNWRAIQSPTFLNPANVPLGMKFRQQAKLGATIAHFPQHQHLMQEINAIVQAPADNKLFEDGITFMRANAELQGADLGLLFGRLATYI